MSTIYNLDKWKKICTTTLNNYINMEKRLSSNKKISDFVLIYYSVFLIVNSLTAIFFETCYNRVLSEYFGIILSIIMLAYSLVNSNANYQQRISNVTKAINELKTLKRNESIEVNDFKEAYDEIVNAIEFRSDVDFFRTVKSMCKGLGICWFSRLSEIQGSNDDTLQIKNYLSELPRAMLQGRIMITYLFQFLLLLFPVAVVVFCITF